MEEQVSLVKNVVNDRILVRPDKDNNKTDGGLHLPSTTSKGTKVGTVVEVGSGKYFGENHVGMCVSIGDRIIYEDYDEKEVTVGGEEFSIIRDNHVILILNEE